MKPPCLFCEQPMGTVYRLVVVALIVLLIVRVFVHG